MRCPKPCWTPMARDGERHVCPACRTVVVLHDPAYIPAPGYTPSPLRVPAPSPFKPLPSEQGWEQGGSPELVLDDEDDTPRARAQAARRARETSEERAEVARKGALTKALAREARMAAREATRAIDAATRTRAARGAVTAAWYAARRSA